MSAQLNERSIMTHAKVVDMDERPIISGEASDCACDQASFGDKASSMLD
jgi:hypothetical protein